MEEIKRSLSLLCGYGLLHTALSLLIPEGGIKRFAHYAFSLIRLMIVINLLKQMLYIISGVFT